MGQMNWQRADIWRFARRSTSLFVMRAIWMASVDYYCSCVFGQKASTESNEQKNWMQDSHRELLCLFRPHHDVCIMITICHSLFVPVYAPALSLISPNNKITHKEEKERKKLNPHSNSNNSNKWQHHEPHEALWSQRYYNRIMILVFWA